MNNLRELQPINTSNWFIQLHGRRKTDLKGEYSKKTA